MTAGFDFRLFLVFVRCERCGLKVTATVIALESMASNNDELKFLALQL
jgi:hypothetical protein